MKKFQRRKLGNIYAIPLPNGEYGFGRELQEGGLAVYKHIDKSIDDMPSADNKEYQFIVTVYRKVLTSGKWKIIGNIPFENEEDSWQPPKYIWDVFTGKYQKYYKGQITPSTKAECQGLEPASVWDTHHVVDRIMGDDKWQKAASRELDYINRFGQDVFDELTKDS